MKKLLYLLILLGAASCSAQVTNIKKTAGINYTRQAPSGHPNENTASEFAIDTITGYVYQWHRDPGPTNDGSWLRLGQGIDVRTDSVPPAYTPARNMSWFAINAVDSLYHYSGTGTVWNHLNPGGGGGGGTWGTITGNLPDQADLQAELDAKTSDVLEGYGIDATYAGNDVTVTVDTSLMATTYDAQSVYRNWPLGTVNSYQAADTKRNWIIYNNNIQSASTRNAFMRFDTIGGGNFSTTNDFGNGIWMASSTSVADMLSGFSNQVQHGGGYNLMASGSINFSDWKSTGTRGSILKALNWTTGTGDAAVTFFKSHSTSVTNGLTNVPAGGEIGAIRWCAADTARALNSTNPLLLPPPMCAIVGYAFRKQWNNAHYGGIGIWTTNGSTTQIRAMAVDSTISTTLRVGVNALPGRINSLQVNGLTSAAGNNSLAVHNLTGTSNSLIVTNDGKTGLGVAAPAEKLEVAGNVKLTTAGNKIFIATGANASAGSTTLVGGTVTVSTTAITTNSIVIVVCKTPIVTQGILSVPAADIVNGTSFKINSTSVADASDINWWIIN